MSRETELKRLEKMRAEILKVYSCLDRCEKLEKDITELNQEKEKPAPLSFRGQTENSYSSLKAQYELDNKIRIQSGSRIEHAFIIANVVLIAVITLIFFSDLFFKTDILISRTLIIAYESSSGIWVLMVGFMCHVAVSMLAAILPIIKLWR